MVICSFNSDDAQHITFRSFNNSAALGFTTPYSVTQVNTTKLLLKCAPFVLPKHDRRHQGRVEPARQLDGRV